MVSIRLNDYETHGKGIVMIKKESGRLLGLLENSVNYNDDLEMG
jgi:hypothetical protein